MIAKKNTLYVRLEAKPNPDYSHTGDHRGSVKVKETFARCRNYPEASAICARFCDDHDLGGGNWTGGQIFEDGKQVAHVSYNGRIWWGKEQAPKVGKVVHFYKAFPTIAIPQCLDQKPWSDESWGNDVTARSQKPLDDVHTIEVWVYAILLEDRETPDYIHRYVVTKYNDNGDELGEPIYCNTEQEIVQAVERKEREHANLIAEILRKEGKSRKFVNVSGFNDLSPEAQDKILDKIISETEK